MGWLANLFKSLFTEEVDDNPEQIKIHINDLQDWVRIRSEEIVYKHKLNDSLTNYVNHLKDKRWSLEVKIDEWEKKIASLGLSYKTENISTIFRATKKFLDLLTFPDQPTFQLIFDFNLKIEDDLEKLQNVVQASSFSYNYSFILSKEEKGLAINPLLKELIDLTNLKENFEKKISQSGYTKLENLKRKALLLEDSRDKLKQLQDELVSKSERLKKIEETKINKEKELTSINEDPELSQIIQAKARKEELFKKIEELDDLIFLFFSKLKPALRQFSDFNPGNRLITDYLNNCTETFYHDEGLAIISLLKNLKYAVEGGKINLLPQQNEDFFNLVSESDKLENLQKKYFRIIKELEKLNIPANINKDFSFKLEEAKYRVEHFSKQKEKITEAAGDLEEGIKDMKVLLKREIELFQNLVKISLDKEIEIKI
jgi:hypothetical protein